MTRLLAAFAALTLIAVSTVASAQTGWRTHAYPELGLTIDMPGEPVVSRSTGSGSGETVITVSPDPTIALMLRVMDKAVAGGSEDAAIDAGIRGGAAAIEAQVVSNVKITYRGWPARDVVLRSPSQMLSARVRIVIVEGRLHQLLIGYPLDQPMPTGSERFLNSLNVKARGAI